MARFFKSIILSAVCVLGVAAAFSCTDDNGGGNGPTLQGTSIMLPNEADATVTFELTFDSDWQVQSNELWFSIYPLSGNAGTIEFTIKALETNPELYEKVSYFDIVSGESVRFYVVQDVTPGFDIEDTYTFGGFPFDFQLDYDANVGDVSVDVDADWVTVGEAEAEGMQLADGSISKLVSYSQILTVTENTTGAAREAVLTLTGTDSTVKEVILRQNPPTVSPAEFDREFIRRSLAFRFTADWCGYCPNMNLALHDALEQCPDNLVAVNLYQTLGNWSFEYINQYMTLYEVGGYPSGIFNGYASVDNYGQTQLTQMFVNLTNEAKNNLPSTTVIGGKATLEGNVITVSADIASKSAGEYIVVAMLLEDGVISTQANYYTGTDNNYQHDNIARLVLTENPTGDPISITANGYASVSYTVEVPANVVAENTHVLVYVSKAGTYKGSVMAVSYGDFGTYVDNVVNIPLGETVEFGYQE